VAINSVLTQNPCDACNFVTDKFFVYLVALGAAIFSNGPVPSLPDACDARYTFNKDSQGHEQKLCYLATPQTYATFQDRCQFIGMSLFVPSNVDMDWFFRHYLPSFGFNAGSTFIINAHSLSGAEYDGHWYVEQPHDLWWWKQSDHPAENKCALYYYNGPDGEPATIQQVDCATQKATAFCAIN